jgi:hypothetical protein
MQAGGAIRLPFIIYAGVTGMTAIQIALINALLPGDSTKTRSGAMGLSPKEWWKASGARQTIAALGGSR